MLPNPKSAEIVEMKIPTSEEKSTMKTSNIIMVDDEPDVNITIKTALEENGEFLVDTFNDAESALFAFKPGHYDLAILDIKMLGMNGFQLCKRLIEIDKKLKNKFLDCYRIGLLSRNRFSCY
jgi:PleD family two-component response regulator